MRAGDYGSAADPARKLRLKYAATCYVCKRRMEPGEYAIWEPRSKRSRHLDCAERRPEPMPPGPRSSEPPAYGMPLASGARAKKAYRKGSSATRRAIKKRRGP